MPPTDFTKLPPDERRCTRIVKRNSRTPPYEYEERRCKQWAMLGLTVCRFHGGGAPHVKAAGKRRVVVETAKVRAKEKALAYASRMIAAEGLENVDPAQKLVETLLQWDALSNYWGEMCAALDVASAEKIGQGLRGELKYSAPTDELDELAVGTNDHLLGFNRHGEAAIHPFVLEYKDALRERAKVAKMCLDAGIAERRVKLAEAQGKLIANVIRGLVAEIEKMLGQPISSRPEFAPMVRRQLALVSGG